MKQPPHGKATSRFADKPVQRNAANARERSRMRTLSKAFCKLKTTLPWVPADTKLSKLDTLRLASCYISYLKEVLEEPDGQNCDASKTPKHPMTMAWPILALSSSSHKFPDRSSQAVPKSSVPGNLDSNQYTYDSVKQPFQ
ncbi:hypothetical protein RvY_10669 [Ramazzottius varieornatus]|uniref:BHLH domain-containing protein n=1 Tax=Ramazzottius varieornatus TaxID=947166 RepID=A0A1D1VFK9_RAMVA|nr:hypothetical protein RvY_10669 [Ramazzottius varieornatus]